MRQQPKVVKHQADVRPRCLCTKAESVANITQRIHIKNTELKMIQPKIFAAFILITSLSVPANAGNSNGWYDKCMNSVNRPGQSLSYRDYCDSKSWEGRTCSNLINQCTRYEAAKNNAKFSRKYPRTYKPQRKSSGNYRSQPRSGSIRRGQQ